VVRHDNCDGFLGSAVYLQKQQYSAKEIPDCLNVASVIALYNMGSLDRAKNAALKIQLALDRISYF
jgi:hypothetical protein